jgi:DNA repair exonuclease SbcCD ATPase subunit
MLRNILMRPALPILLAATSFSGVSTTQAQDTQSVAEAARRAREQKKAPAKPTKVITDETLNVKDGDVQSAVAEEPRMPGAPEAKAQPAAGTANGAASGSTSAPGAKDKAALEKVIAELKAKIKETISDIDLLQREVTLDQDTYFSNPDYIHDTAGKANLDSLKQQVSDKRQDLENLKARLSKLQSDLDSSVVAPPKP